MTSRPCSILFQWRQHGLPELRHFSRARPHPLWCFRQWEEVFGHTSSGRIRKISAIVRPTTLRENRCHREICYRAFRRHELNPLLHGYMTNKGAVIQNPKAFLVLVCCLFAAFLIGMHLASFLWLKLVPYLVFGIDEVKREPNLN